MTANVILPQAGTGRKTRIVKEGSPGDTPVSANWDILRNTGGDGVSNEVTTETSEELTGDILGIQDLSITEQRGIFSYSFDLSKHSPFELIFESLLGSTFGDIDPDILYPGKQEITYTLEDELTGVEQSEHVKAAVSGDLTLTLAARSVINGEISGAGGDTAPGKVDEVTGVGDTSFTAPDQIEVLQSFAAWVVPGKFVQVLDSSNNNGYYKILNVAGNVLTVDGTITTEPNTSAKTIFNSQSLKDETTGTDNPRETNPRIRCGNAVKAEIDDLDVLVYGLRLPEAVINIVNELRDLDEITEDKPYGQLKVDRTVTITMQFHVINLFPQRVLQAETEFKLFFEMLDSAGSGYRFTFPRCKTAEGTKGPAAREEMVGTWTVQGLLDSNDRNVIIERVTA